MRSHKCTIAPHSCLTVDPRLLSIKTLALGVVSRLWILFPYIPTGFVLLTNRKANGYADKEEESSQWDFGTHCCYTSAGHRIHIEHRLVYSSNATSSSFSLITFERDLHSSSSSIFILLFRGVVFHSSLLGMSFILYSFYLLSVVLALAFSRLLLASSILKKNLLTFCLPPADPYL